MMEGQEKRTSRIMEGQENTDSTLMPSVNVSEDRCIYIRALADMAINRN
jgi:hypothetical protein